MAARHVEYRARGGPFRYRAGNCGCAGARRRCHGCSLLLIALLQRVIHARVEIGGISVASIDRGLLVLVAMERGDDSAQVDRMLERILTYRV
ncbi:MAG: D-aminoacyl-tRNA deacylase, partial [Pseudomonadota bacterium]|nr:D-aminoacyl-tRNA deacylase [Pseudomonadota bacterium]